MLREMVLAGMNVARLNFSHGAHEDHAKVVASIRAIARELKRPMAIIADLQGPKIRVGRLDGERQLVTGDMVTIITRDLPEPRGRRARRAAGQARGARAQRRIPARRSCWPTARSACT